tara:strand:- start:432 stop:902 length:471 start_codon:yes stop_codon:yes gene_type:complete
MARRKSRKSRRRSSPKRTNVLNVAQSIILGNAVTEGLFNTNMYEFVTGRINGSYTPGAIGQGSQITLPELLGAGMGTVGRHPSAYAGSPMQTSGYGGVVGMTFTQQVQENIKNNGVSMMTTLIVAPIAFKVVSKLAKKPRSEFNKLARNVGLPISM